MDQGYEALACGRGRKGTLTMKQVTFDTSLPELVDIVVRNWGEDAARSNLFLREASGRLTFVVLDLSRDGQERTTLSEKVNAELGPYSDSSGLSVATPEELFDDGLRNPQSGYMMNVSSKLYSGPIRLLDRRVVGADWLRSTSNDIQSVPRLFFVSLKGGVGRSTALCVLAAHIASRGRRVLAVDLDLEAPGLGSLLLTEQTLPEYGVLDYLVEAGLGNVGDAFLKDMLAPSSISAGRGIVSVVPAIGRAAARNPQNVLAKIARAYLSQDSGASEPSSFSDKIDNLLNAYASSGDHDVILVDARAGLHETTAAAIILSGDTLLFGIEQLQTFAGYKVLFAQLALTSGSRWRDRIHFVQARVGSNGPSDSFLAAMRDALQPEKTNDNVETGIPLEELRGVFDIDWRDSTEDENETSTETLEGDLDCTFIYDSDLFKTFDPLSRPDRLEQGAYGAIFGDFLARCSEIIEHAEASEDRTR